jgi:diguanylate cyclase (GGDEF)-like protein
VSQLQRSPSSVLRTPPAAIWPADRVQRTVHLFERGREHDQLAEALATIGYHVVRNATVEGLAKAASNGAHAAIVGGSDPDAFGICMSAAPFCPVLLVTADRTFEQSLRAARVGVAAVVASPLDFLEVADWLEELIGERAAAQLSVLIVDDDELLAEGYALAFQAADIKALTVAEARDALDALAATAPDILLLDMQMPDVDGLELARMIRQSRKYLSLPIVFLSAERDPARQLEARRLGGDDFIVKPVDLRRLVALVRMRAERSIALRSMMERDGLTGLFNHARFKERVAHELERCRRSGAEVSLALFDLDRFKAINDTHGHACGDRVIRAMARTLTMNLRRTDIVGRLGGEEFGVLMLDTPPAAAAQVADKLRARFSEIVFRSAGRTFRATFSGGVSGSCEHDDMAALVEAADTALYGAKRAGRDRIALDPVSSSGSRH